MNILFVSALLPYPLYSGGQVRIYNLLKILSSKHKITLFSFIREESEKQYLQELNFCQKVETVLRGHAWQPRYVVPAVFGKYPLLLASYNHSEMRRKIGEEINNGNYDLIHLEPGYVFPSVPDTRLPLVVAEHNIESTIYQDYVRRFPFAPVRTFFYADVLKLKFWERHIWQKARGIVTVSEDDARVIAPKTNGQKKALVPNGVDPVVFPFKPNAEVDPSLKFLFVGNFSWLQNRDALGDMLRRIWPEVVSKFPKSQLIIVGKQMPASLKRLADKAQARRLDEVVDINNEYQKADIMLAPIRIGGGTKFKILEAMASGLPVVTTAKGVQGLNVTDRQEVMLAETPEAYVKAIEELVKTNKRKQIVSAARLKIDKVYTWRKIANKLADLWEQVVQKNE